MTEEERGVSVEVSGQTPLGLTRSGAGNVISLPAGATRPRCPSARRAIVFYSKRYAAHRAKMGAPKELVSAGRSGKCPQARFLARIWRSRAFVARESAEVIAVLNARRILKDFEVRDGNHAWLRGIEEVQKIFPGTETWLRSCSAPQSEGGWGRWVTYRDAYTAEEAAANYIVGGWLQFKLPTFKGFFRRALETVRKRGYKIPPELQAASDIEAWQSPLAQALAGGWAATNGEKDHWVGSGC